jgi:hypothetical protein
MGPAPGRGTGPADAHAPALRDLAVLFAAIPALDADGTCGQGLTAGDESDLGQARGPPRNGMCVCSA